VFLFVFGVFDSSFNVVNHVGILGLCICTAHSRTIGTHFEKKEVLFCGFIFFNDL